MSSYLDSDNTEARQSLIKHNAPECILKSRDVSYLYQQHLTQTYFGNQSRGFRFSTDVRERCRDRFRVSDWIFQMNIWCFCVEFNFVRPRRHPHLSTWPLESTTDVRWIYECEPSAVEVVVYIQVVCRIWTARLKCRRRDRDRERWHLSWKSFNKKCNAQ